MADLSAERRANLQDKKNALDALVGNKAPKKSSAEMQAEKAISD